MQTNLTSRPVLVTGGSGAIGRAIAIAYAREGAKVAITYNHNEAAAAEVCDEVERAGGLALRVRYDQSQVEAAAELLETVTSRLGAPRVVVANAVQWPTPDLGEIPGLSRSLHTNAVGPLAVVDAALPALRASHQGRIVLISTDVVAQPMAGPLSYVAAKGAIEAAARVLAVREAQHGVLTNVVRPGFTLTRRVLATPWLGQQAVDAEAACTPTGRISTPEDVARTVLYLGSGANTHVNGQVLSVAGAREQTR